MEIALTIDADTRHGASTGLPALLDLLAAKSICATIFATLGPPGVSAERLDLPAEGALRKGFLARMIGGRAPAPDELPLKEIVEPLLLRARSDGHEIAARPDNLQRWASDLIAADPAGLRENFFGAAHRIEGLTEESLHGFSSPGWIATPNLLDIEDERELLWASDCRGTTAFLPTLQNREFKTLQIPVTLPTWSEVLGSPGLDEASLLAFYRSSVREGIAQVHRIHAEIEGCDQLPLFEQLVTGWKQDGVRFVRLETVARRALSRKGTLARRPIQMRQIPGRKAPVCCEG